jgi:hypothetical protein
VSVYTFSITAIYIDLLESIDFLNTLLSKMLNTILSEGERAILLNE